MNKISVGLAKVQEQNQDQYTKTINNKTNWDAFRDTNLPILSKSVRTKSTCI